MNKEQGMKNIEVGVICGVGFLREPVFRKDSRSTGQFVNNLVLGTDIMPAKVVMIPGLMLS